MKKIVFDIETRNAFSDVGRNDPSLLDISIVGLYDYETDTYKAFTQEEFPQMWPYFEHADMIIGFNSNHFDTPLLNKYYPGDLAKIKSLDILEKVRESLGRRVGLASIAEATLGYGKSGHGLEAIEWWKQGEIQKIKEYCLQDVKVTKEVYEYALKNGGLYYTNNRDGKNEKMAVKLDTNDWETENENAITHSLGF